MQGETSRLIDNGTFEVERLAFLIEDNEFEIDHLGARVLFNLQGVPGGSRRTDAGVLDDLSDNPTISFQLLSLREDSPFVFYRFNSGAIPTLRSGEAVLDYPLTGHQVFLGIRWEWFDRETRRIRGAEMGVNISIVPFDAELIAV